MKSMRRPILIIAATILIGFLIVYGGLHLWINTGPGLGWLQKRINAAIPGSVSIDGFRLSLLRLRLELDGVSLNDPRGTPVAGFEKFLVTLRWLPLLRREIHLTDVRLHSPWADLLLDRSSGLNLMSVFATPGSEASDTPAPDDGGGLPFNIVCQSFQLTKGRLSFRSTDDPMRISADGIGLSVAGDLAARRADLDVEVDHARYQTPGIQPPPAHIALKARLDGNRLRRSTVKISAGKTRADLELSVEALTTDAVVDGMLSIESQLAELKEVFNIQGDYQGPIRARLSLKGALANPLAQLGLTIDGGRVAGQPLDRFHFSAGLEDRQATITDTALRLADGAISLKGAADLRTAFPTGFLGPPADLNAISYVLDLAPDIPDLTPWLKPWTQISGILRGGIHIAGKGVAPSAMSTRLTIGAKGQHLRAPGMAQPVEAELNASAQVDQGRINIERLDAATDGLSLSGVASFGMQDHTLTGDVVLTAPDLSPALAVAGIESVRGALNATIRARGSIDQPQLSLNLAANNLGAETYTLGNLDIDASLDPDGMLNLSTLVLKNKNSRIHGNGRLRLQFADGQIDPDFNMTAALDITSLSAADFMVSPPVDGKLDGRLTVSGPLKSLQGALSLKAVSLASQAAAIGDMDTRLVWDNGTVVLDRLGLTNQSSTLTATGHLQLLHPGSVERIKDPTFSLNVNSDHLNPGDFIESAKGDFALRAALNGTLGTPEGTIAINGERIDLAGQSLTMASFDGRVGQGKLWIDRLVAAVAPEQEINADGWLGMDQTMAIRVKTDGIALTNIQPLKERAPGNGILHLNANARGSVQNPDIEGDLTLSDVTINDEAIDDMYLAFSLQDMRVKAKGNLNVALDASCDLRQGDFNIDLVFDNTETASYFKAAGMPDLHGKLSGQVNAVGNINDALSTKANVTIDALHLLSRDISLVKTDQLSMQLADRKLTIPEFEMRLLTSGKLHLNGQAHLDGDLEMAIDGRLPLAAAGAFRPELADAAGILALKGQVSGTTDAPRINARIDLENIAMLVPGIVQKLHDLNGQILLSDNAIQVKNVSGFLDTGSFRLDGTIGHKNFTPTAVDLSINATALPVEVPDTLSVLLNTDIGIQGQNGTATAEGEIVVLEGLYYKDVKINLLKLATERQRSVTTESEPIKIPYFDTVNLDIAIGHRQAFQVENNMAALEISPDLHVGGTLAQPIISGRAQVKEGTVTFQKKTFEVTKGVIDFVNPYKTQAEIDIASQAQIRTWTITLTIKGPPDNLDLKLSSVPSETDSDILSLVLFGKTGRELNNGEGGSKLSTGQIMTELIANTFGEDIKKSTGIDILQVEENGSSDDEEAGGVTVTVGKHLTERMTVKYAVESKDGEIIQRAISEYKLLENILVSGFQDSKGIYGSELVFRIEFR